MAYEELSESEKAIWDEAFAAGVDAENNSDAIDVGYDRGWDDGWEAAVTAGSDEYDDGYRAGYDAGRQAGVEAEQARIQYVLQMMFDSALNLGQGNKAVQYKNMMDLLKPIEIAPYTDED